MSLLVARQPEEVQRVEPPGIFGKDRSIDEHRLAQAPLPMERHGLADAKAAAGVPETLSGRSHS
jgi:hypothetical protein